MEFRVDRHLVEGVEVIEVEGELDVYTSPVLLKALTEVQIPGFAGVVLDLEAVDFLDSTGLGVVVGAQRRARQNGGLVQLVCTNILILEIFLITGLSKSFGIHPSVEEAVAAIRRQLDDED